MPMGAAATKETSEGCRCCQVKFTITKKKFKCNECSRQICSSCITAVPGKHSRRHCRQCKVVLSQHFTRADLKPYTARELLSFLKQWGADTRGCVEKSDFEGLLLQYTNHPEHASQETQNKQHLEELQRRAQNLPEPKRRRSSSPTLTSNNEPNVPAGSTAADSNSRVESEPMADQDTVPPEPGTVHIETTDSHIPDVHNTPHDTNDVPLATSHMPNTANEGPNDVSAPSGATGETGGSAAADEQQSAREDQPGAKNENVFRLSDITSREQIPTLTTRQLRTVLATSFVNAKGIIEKQELIKKVEQLWDSQQYTEEPRDEDLCRLCMDRRINCVLLECGHILTCTECGKQLAECPVCRQYVVKVVRVFKA